jgi:dihydroxyacid dehydratase/phosphogluconate dehydratase
LRNIRVAKLDCANYKLKEISKKTKTSAKTIHTHSKNSTLKCWAQVQGGLKTFIQFIRSVNKTSNEKTIAKEEASENFGLDMLKGFLCRDLSVVKSSLWKY